MSLSISPNSVLVVIGSGPGIGLATAIHFASHGFRKVALVSRNAERLQKDREAVIHAVNQASNKEIEVKTWSTDITVTSELKKTLSEVQEMGDVKCVHFNAARVSPSAFFEFDEETLGNDFAV